MRRRARVTPIGPVERLGTAVAAMPTPVRRALDDVAARTDLPLVAGTWRDDDGGCLVANAVACAPVISDADTWDLRMLDAFPQMSSRDLNTLIVAWDEATTQAAVADDAGRRALLCAALAWAHAAPPMTDEAALRPPMTDEAGAAAPMTDEAGAAAPSRKTAAPASRSQ